MIEEVDWTNGHVFGFSGREGIVFFLGKNGESFCIDARNEQLVDDFHLYLVKTPFLDDFRLCLVKTPFFL